jgi:hypothetical protein
VDGFRRVAFQENPDAEKPEENHDVSEDNDVSEESDVSENSDDDEPSTSATESSETEDDVEICQFITKARNNQFQVQLVLSSGSLRLKRECFPRKRFLTNVPSTSLGKLLKHAKLSERNKAILSYLLVDSVWQYYDSSWEEWSNKTVQFMSQRIGLHNSLEVVFVNQPFLYSRFDRKGSEANTSIKTAENGSVKRGGLKKSQPVTKVKKAQERKSHNYPKILALGIMLLEIQLGCKLKSFKTSDYYDQDLKIAQHLLALDLLQDKTLWPPENAWLGIKQIIEICIDREKSRKAFGKDSLMVRQRLFEQVVAPFRVFILEAWKPKGIDDVDPVTLEKVKCAGKDATQVTTGLSVTGSTVQTSTSPSSQMMQDRVRCVYDAHLLN